MPYIKAKYAPPGPIPDPPDMAKPVLALDDQGIQWSLREDSEVGDWLRYIEGGGTIDPVDTVWPETQPVPSPELDPEAPPTGGSADGGPMSAIEPNVLQDAPVEE
jgi:hypothetical protein